MTKRLFLALAATCFVLAVVPFIFFGFASLMLFDITPLVFMYKRVLEFPDFEISRQLAIIFSSIAIFILVAIYQERAPK